MMTHTGTLWHYLASFVLYTGLAIGVIYAVYFYARKHGGTLWNGPKRPQTPAVALEIETTLPLEPRKNLYVVRAGHERFLIATAMESTQFLSRLETPPEGTAQAGDSAAGNAMPGSNPASPPFIGQAGQPGGPNASNAIDLPPWYAQPDTLATDPRASARSGVRARLIRSVQWLIASRSR